MTTVHERLVEARRALVQAGFSEADAALDAEVIARHVLGWDRAALLTRWREPEPGDLASRLAPLIARRGRREPVAYITGRREFWGLDFEVTPDVLIPRPETELVIEEVRRLAGQSSPLARALDVGTGSGCIAIALAVEFPNLLITATDLSPAALTVAARNARRHGVADRVSFVVADLLDTSAAVEAAGERSAGPAAADARAAGADRPVPRALPVADVIAANPPYVPEADRAWLQPEVMNHEPAMALFGGSEDGLKTLRRLLETAPAHLAPGGALVMEFGDGQEDGVRLATRAAGWKIDRMARDLQDLPRVAVLRR